jgi:glutaredoxin
MVLIYSTSFCSDCWRIKKALESLQVPYREVDINQDEEGYDDLVRLSPGRPRVPTVVLHDGTVLIEPDVVTIAERLAA